MDLLVLYVQPCHEPKSLVNADKPHTQTPSSFTLSVVLQRQSKIVNGWESIQWDIAAVLSDPDGPARVQDPITIQDTESVSQYLWKGLRIKLFVDACEGYWYNLMSDKPYVFVVCEQDVADDEPPIPILVTASQDEAGAHLETDALVLSAPLPPDILDGIERFVVNHYVPQVKKKRKRRNWVEESIRMNPQN